jgi:acyl-CoA synthetase (AMP-forming)/AMP-acid ligase II
MPETYLLKELSRYPVGTWADIMNRNALLFPDDEAFVYKTERVTFSGFNARVNRLINALQSMGVKKGETIGVLSWNCLEYADLYGAAMKGGFILSPFNPRLQANELDYLINYSETGVLFVGPELMDVVDQLQPRLPRVKQYVALEASGPTRAPYTPYAQLLATYPAAEPDIQPEEDDPCIIYYTSGTTGVPRGALCSQRQRIEDTRTKALQLNTKPKDRHILIMPLFHIGGSGNTWTYFYVGGCNVIAPERVFDPAATMRAIVEEKATDIHIVPTHLVSILALPDLKTYDVTRLKRIWYAASPMPTELLRKGVETFGPIFMQCYGQSESGPDITFLSSEDHDVLGRSPEEQQRLASCGRPCMGVHVRIVDQQGLDLPVGTVGEIIVKSKRIMMGYWRKPEDTKNVLIDGWLHTGDMGYYDEKGYLYIADRKKDMIVSGGENIFPREVEEVLYQHPAVLEAAVIGIPDSYWVESAHAVVTLKQGMAVSDKELIDFCKQRLARYKAPKSVEFVSALPKNASGKIMKRELREKYWQGKERKV